jgi:hypothetical protein
MHVCFYRKKLSNVISLLNPRIAIRGSAHGGGNQLLGGGRLLCSLCMEIIKFMNHFYGNLIHQ